MTRTRNTGPPPEMIRLQRFLSDAGVASRRKCEELIEAGRVLVNDQIVTQLPAFVNPKTDVVIADGAVVKQQPPLYFILHKPKNVVCTHRDPAGRVRAVDLLPPLEAKMFPVGRLDAESTGLLLLTNDGQLAQRIAHPSHRVEKVYRVEISGWAPDDLPKQLMEGVYLAEGRARAHKAEIAHRSRERSTIDITLQQGRNRQIRRMLARFGYKVKKLKRTQIGPLTLKHLPVGAARELTAGELHALRALLQRRKPRRPTGRRTGGGRAAERPSKKPAGAARKSAPRKSASKAKRKSTTTPTKPSAPQRRERTRRLIE